MNTAIITIDGPSGSGKGTLASKLAAHYQYNLLDSGAIYRLLGLSLARQNLLMHLADQKAQCREIALQLNIEFKPHVAGMQVFLDGDNVTDVIRTEEVGSYASQVAVVPELREALLVRQQNFAQGGGLVADGRDMGTVVFPQAQAKLYLTASAESRAARRYKQLQAIGVNDSIDAILANIKARDKRDMEREVAPLRPAEDAYIIDSSNLSIDDVFAEMLRFIDSKLA
ncbi:(d)CMP kinase [Acinetobacter apis]|uniref:Cytidylate kinase n=1 Tax=Acinetobacter apis TaxID=1229165 RepID=A0A217EDL4_9GAMM|nr:(d)CMP kinase [Acinetobacter apis]SNQ28593.1 cytidylate kinase [Acinetobacter apis]